MLLLIGDNNQQGELLNMIQLQKKIDVKYPTFLALKEILKNQDLLKCKNGKQREIHLILTDKGKRVYDLLKEVSKIE